MLNYIFINVHKTKIKNVRMKTHVCTVHKLPVNLPLPPKTTQSVFLRLPQLSDKLITYDVDTDMTFTQLSTQNSDPW